jgi:hypothetical protein
MYGNTYLPLKTAIDVLDSRSWPQVYPDRPGAALEGSATMAAQPEAWPEAWRPLPPPEPQPLTLTCPCPLKGLRCGDCMLIAIAGPPPFTATPLGWLLATCRRLGWRIREAIFGPPTDIDD